MTYRSRARFLGLPLIHVDFLPALLAYGRGRGRSKQADGGAP